MLEHIMPSAKVSLALNLKRQKTKMKALVFSNSFKNLMWHWFPLIMLFFFIFFSSGPCVPVNLAFSKVRQGTKFHLIGHFLYLFQCVGPSWQAVMVRDLTNSASKLWFEIYSKSGWDFVLLKGHHLYEMRVF